jgi:hypothetical protein
MDQLWFPNVEFGQHFGQHFNYLNYGATTHVQI